MNNQTLKNAILQRIGKTQTNNLFFEYIKKLHKRKTSTGLHVESYLSSLNLLQAYDKDLTFEDITINFYHNYITNLFALNYSKNYVGVQIKNIKTIMNGAFNEKPPLHQNLDFKRNDFKKPTANTFSISLSPIDIHKIYITKDLPKRLEVTRDRFILACDTGLRFQNWEDVHDGNIKEYQGKKVLVIFTHKKDKIVAIPPSRRVMKILNKYDGKLPPIRSNREVNESLKEIGKLAGLTRTTQKVVQRKNKDITNVPLFELLHSHCARISFVTNLKNLGVQDSDIIKMTGHASVKSMTTYDKESAVENALKIQEHITINQYLSKVK